MSDGKRTQAELHAEASYEDKLAKAMARRKQLRRKVIAAMMELEKVNGHIGWLHAKIAAERGGND